MPEKCVVASHRTLHHEIPRHILTKSPTRKIRTLIVLVKNTRSRVPPLRQTHLLHAIAHPIGTTRTTKITRICPNSVRNSLIAVTHLARKIKPQSNHLVMPTRAQLSNHTHTLQILVNQILVQITNLHRNTATTSIRTLVVIRLTQRK